MSNKGQGEDREQVVTNYNRCVKVNRHCNMLIKLDSFQCTINAVTHRSAPAQDNILLIRITWNGCRRTRRWKASLPQDFTRYLLAQMRPASNASDDICSNSSDTKWTHRGRSSTFAFFRPRSKIRIFGSKINTSVLDSE